MTALAHQPIGGLDTLETSLNDLRRSQLMVIPEFKNMFGAIEKHHNDLKFAHITGKARDLLDQAIRDTKFYNILIKMLCEVKQRRTGDQRAGLRKVYMWYMANKHVLYCGPRFGKEVMKEEAKEVLRKATTPRAVKPITSARDQSLINDQVHKVSPDHEQISTVLDTQADASATLVEELNLDLDANRDELMDQKEFTEEGEGDSWDEDDSESCMPPRILSRPKTAISVTFTNLKEQSQGPPKVLTMIHPIPSLVNPHAQFARELAAAEAGKKENGGFISKIGPGSRSEHLQLWQAFNKSRSYGQDIVGKLNFVGRSGTAMDVRYAAHSNGEVPEAYTAELIQQYARDLNVLNNTPRTAEDEENVFVRQTLEEFYQTADDIRPTTRNTSRMSSYARVKSAPARHRGVIPPQTLPTPPYTKQISPPQKLGHQLEQTQSPANFPVPEIDTGVKLNVVVNVIDSVTDDMAYFKEKLAPQPQHGFRQPSTAGLPTPRSEDFTTGQSSSGHRTSPTPDADGVPRPFTTPYSTHAQHESENMPAGLKNSKLRCKSAGGIDWRGRIQPESLRYKWSKTKFGVHTYLKKWNTPSLRSAGSTSAGKRPKTAPMRVQEKWSTQKESDKNSRPVQAASHSTTLVDQNDVNNMMTVQHLLPGDDGIDPRDLYDFDQKFWKNIRKSSVSIPTEPAREFVSFVTPTSSTVAEKKSHPHGDISHPLPGTAGGEGITRPEKEQLESTFTDLQYNQDALSEAVKEIGTENTQQEEISVLSKCIPAIEPQVTVADSSLSNLFVPMQQPEEQGKPLLTDKPRSVSSHQYNTLREKSINSVPWNKSEDNEFHEPDVTNENTTHHFSYVQIKEEHFCSECQPNMKSSRVERSAGRMPSRSHSASAQLLGYNRRCTDALRRAPPLRTPPSIPSSQHNFTQEKKGGQIFLELEHHARRTKSPRNFMQKIEGLRSGDSFNRPSIPNNSRNDSIMGMSLQVCKLPVARKTDASKILSELVFDADHLHSKYSSDQMFLSHDQSMPGLRQGLYSSQKQVSFSDLKYLDKPMTAPALGAKPGLEDQQTSLQRSATNVGIRQSKGRLSDGPPSPGGRSLAKIGRPIAQVSQVTDPDDLQLAVQLQKEAAAAVDIQRIFRGFVARNIYKSLLSEERMMREEKQKAAIQIQRMYREHLLRKDAIYNRSPLSPEIVQWSKDIKGIQTEKAAKRQMKMENLANEMNSNEKEAKSKISSIGPHVEIYDIYHPKRVGPTMKELNMAATKIQKIVRGWMVRRKIEKLSRKATWYGSSFPKMVKEYKAMLKRVQSQHGVDKVTTPFSIKEFNSYVDIRRRYESVFEKKSFSGELELGELKSFFSECDLYPSQAEIDEALDVSLHGKANKKDNQGLTKKELLDLVFYIYVPPATGLEGTRRSTWMNPIIDGKEARKLLGSEFVEPAPLAPCAKLVIDAKREQRQKEQALKEAEERRRIEESKQRNEERKVAKKLKQVTIQDPDINA